jgi:hypothetical protein
MTRRIVFASLGLLALAGLTFAAGHPDFSGSWKINAAKSDFGQFPAPEKFERVIEHKDPDIKIKTTQTTQMGEMTNESSYKIDGTEQKLESPRGVSLITPKWDGNVMVVTSKRKIKTQDGQEMEMTGEERWTLSEDGKSLTTDTKMTMPMGEFAFKAVFDKQ